MMKRWYVLTVGIDAGGPESGPIFRKYVEYFRATSFEKAEERAVRIVQSHFENENGVDGFGVREATLVDEPKIREHLKFMSMPDDELLPFT